MPRSVTSVINPSVPIETLAAWKYSGLEDSSIVRMSPEAVTIRNLLT